MRAAALSLIHGANAVARPLDRRLFAPRAARALDPIFIVGAPRSGTTLLFQVLAHSLRVAYLPRILNYAYGCSHLVFRLCARRLRRHDPVFASRVGATAGWLSPSESFNFWRRWFWKGESGDHDHPAPLAAEVAADLRRAVYAIEAHHGAPLLVKCLYLSLSIPALAAAFPNSKFIFIRRDPLEVALSMLRVRPLRPWWSIRPSGYLQQLNAPVAHRIMWQVARTAAGIRAALEGLPGARWRMLAYDELCAAPRESVATIARWLDPPVCRWPDAQLPERFEARSPRPGADHALIEALLGAPDFGAAREALR